ncbi:MAG TPA: YcnI family protein [Pseudonocardiaceae bacterium]
MSTNRLVARLGVLAAAGLTTLVTATGVAAAHVTAQPGEATKGGYAKIAFRVPNERSDAGTVKVEVTLPTEYPLTSVSTRPLPGWQATVTKKKLDQPVESHGRTIEEVVSTITWTAEPGVRINPGEFQEFEVSLGRLPENTDRLVLPTTQTYDSGEVVRWEEPPAEDGQEPERPAPVLKLVAGGDGHGHGVDAQPVTDSTESTDEHTTAAGQDETARWLGGAGLALGALGAGLGLGAVLRVRKRA